MNLSSRCWPTDSARRPCRLAPAAGCPRRPSSCICTIIKDANAMDNESIKFTIVVVMVVMVWLLENMINKLGRRIRRALNDGLPIDKAGVVGNIVAKAGLVVASILVRIGPLGKMDAVNGIAGGARGHGHMVAQHPRARA